VFLGIVRATWCSHAARPLLARADWAGAARIFERGLGELSVIPAGAAPQYGAMRRDVQTVLTGLLGETKLRQGDRAAGVRLLREAIDLDPAGAWAPRWRNLANASSGSILP
jgi:hypothetical protein